MLRFAVATTAVLLFTVSLTFAQKAPAPPVDTSFDKFQIFGGYSLFHADAAGLQGPNIDATLHTTQKTFGVNTNFNGWNAEFQYNPVATFGVVADFGGRYGDLLSTTNGVSGMPKFSGYSVMVGPEISHRMKSRPSLKPYIHALFGFDDLFIAASHPTGVTTVSSTPSLTDSSFALVGGGGIDYKMTGHLSFRIAQVDYFYTTHNMRAIYGDLFGEANFQNLQKRQRNARVASGLIYRF